MGTWDTGSFDNDTACDWGYGLQAAEDLSYIEAAFDDVLAAGEEYLDADVGACAVAAGEVVAKLRGRSTEVSAYTESVDKWVAAHKRLTLMPALLAKADAALARVAREPSELLELWSEGEDGEAWTARIAQLRGRVAR